MKIKRILSILVLATLLILALTMSVSAEGGAFVLTADHRKVEYTSAQAAVDAVTSGEAAGDIYLNGDPGELTVGGVCTIFLGGYCEPDVFVFDDSVLDMQVVEGIDGNLIATFTNIADASCLFTVDGEQYYMSELFVSGIVNGKEIVLYGDVTTDERYDRSQRSRAFLERLFDVSRYGQLRLLVRRGR